MAYLDLRKISNACRIAMSCVIILIGSVFWVHSAQAQQIVMDPVDVKFYKNWMKLRKKCDLPVDASVTQSFTNCIRTIIRNDQSSLPDEQKLEKVVYSDIGNEIGKLNKFAYEYRSSVLTGGGDAALISSFFGEIHPHDDIDSRLGIVLQYFFVGAIPIVSVTPLFRNDVAFYNPYLDIAYFTSFDARSGNLSPTPGYLVFGERIRGEAVRDVPYWMYSSETHSNIPPVFERTFESIGKTNIYEKNKKLVNMQEDRSEILGRIIGMMGSAKNAPECSGDVNLTFNSNIIATSRRAKVSNIQPESNEKSKGDFERIAGIKSKNGVYASFLVSAGAPNMSVMIAVTPKSLGKECSINEVNVIDITNEIDQKLKRLAHGSE